MNIYNFLIIDTTLVIYMDFILNIGNVKFYGLKLYIWYIYRENLNIYDGNEWFFR